MRTLVNRATTSSSALVRVALAIVVALPLVWLPGMTGVIQLPLTLVWNFPFLCIVIGAIAILWDGAAFDV